MAFREPTEYAIYDARVIYSLNWLLFENGSEKFFPSPNGRNTLMGALDYTMFLLVKQLSLKHVKEEIDGDIKRRFEKTTAKSRAIANLKKKLYFKKSDAYSHYCKLLNILAIKLFNEGDKHALTKTEMILFAIADKDVVKCVFNKLFPQEDNAVRLIP
ncbi:MAG: hypothetical protein PHU14_10710 [Methylovulum sp.]|nr:hypothetical protein [Methylovulum sp.]